MFNVLSRLNYAIIYNLPYLFYLWYPEFIKMSITYKKRLSKTGKDDLRQGLQCLAHIIAQKYIRKEKEKTIKIIREETNGRN